MQKVLIDRGKFVLEREVQKFQYFCVTLHVDLSIDGRWSAALYAIPDASSDGLHRAARQPLVGEFDSRRGEKRIARLIALNQTGRQRCLSFGKTLAATGADTQLTGQVTHGAGAVFDGGFDVSVGNGLAYTNDHGA